MLETFARLRIRLAVSTLLWACWIVYTSVVVAFVDFWRRENALACLVGSSTSAPGRWRWTPPVGWECDFTEYGRGVQGPGWSLTAMIALIPIGLVALIATGILARRWLRDSSTPEAVIVN